MKNLWIIEARTPDGALDLAAPQPEEVFGPGSVLGMSSDAMAKCIYARVPDITLDGREIPTWPRYIDPRFTAREKTW